ncbi:3D (Asp-Asp-Asp) domain-containing protein [Salinimicrobium catena]|uniref:3D (Asp-Asp-Asp) domain-containing protein n=1 Tax=Salinimicrobium catena TaxID=390640 RepID=A0A1H5LUG1_9FLAO|nr:3D domain-containing protein [Salinimicrobium catena]SDL14624.1 3D (Asp-Asp-Asp) domain-containing protein [Salinimicrobium catena]SEE80682.1 3D (Asp-Asp-Asp) domain-containing protein [Salinimicrobium catena]
MLVMMISEKFILKLLLLPLFFVGSLWSCDEEGREEVMPEVKTMTVTASAYNSLKVQGSGNPKITAWGDTLTPGVKSIAVSRDLIKQGLTYKTPVKIEGLEGIFIVNDKMHSRWKNKIDIYMGIDREKAMNWGRKKVEISFPVEMEE